MRGELFLLNTCYVDICRTTNLDTLLTAAPHSLLRVGGLNFLESREIFDWDHNGLNKNYEKTSHESISFWYLRIRHDMEFAKF